MTIDFLDPKLGSFSEPARAWPLDRSSVVTFLFELANGIKDPLSYKEKVAFFVESCEDSWDSQGQFDGWTADEVVYSACSAIVFDKKSRERPGGWASIFNLLQTPEAALERQVLNYLLFFKKLFPVEFYTALHSYFDLFDHGINDYRMHPELVERMFLTDSALEDIIFLSVGFQENYLDIFNEIKKSKVFTILKKHIRRYQLQELNLDCFLRLEDPLHCQTMVSFLQDSGLFETLDEELEKNLEIFRTKELFPCFIQLRFNTIFVPPSLNTRNVTDMREFISTLNKSQQDLIRETIEKQKKRGLSVDENKPVLKIVSKRVVELAAPLLIFGLADSALAVSSVRIPTIPLGGADIVYITPQQTKAIQMKQPTKSDQPSLVSQSRLETNVTRQNIKKGLTIYPNVLKQRWKLITNVATPPLVPTLTTRLFEPSEKVKPLFIIEGQNVKKQLPFASLSFGGGGKNVYTVKPIYKDPSRGFYVSPQNKDYPALIVTREKDNKRLLVLEGLQQAHSANLAVCKVLNQSPIHEIKVKGFDKKEFFDGVEIGESDHVLNKFDGGVQQMRSVKAYNCNCPAVILLSKPFHQSGNILTMWQCPTALYEEKPDVNGLFECFNARRAEYIIKVYERNPGLLLRGPKEYIESYQGALTEVAEKYKKVHNAALSNPSDAVLFFTANRLYGNIRATVDSLTISSDRLELTNSTPTNNKNSRSGEWSNLQIIGEDTILKAIRLSRALANSLPLAVKGPVCREILSSYSNAHDQLEASVLLFTKFQHPNLHKILAKEFASGEYRYLKSENIIQDIQTRKLHLPKRFDLLYLQDKPTKGILL